MKAEIISIGDEILIGQIVNTNAAWMAQQLNLAGIEVCQVSSVSDSKDHIISSFREAEKRADIILITGGLGPTKDDITKHTLCDYFNTSLKLNEDILKDVKKIFYERGLELTSLNKKQAEVPENCTPIRNMNGTAPGMWFEQNGKIYISMPGVPYEMKAIMTEYVLPELKRKLELPNIFHKTVLTEGIGESFLSEKIADWENSLAEMNIRLAYLPSPGMVKLRLTSSGTDRKQLESNTEKKIKELSMLIPDHIYGYETFGEDPLTIEKIVGELLSKKSKSISTAESCTGGYLAHLITKVPGSSAYYKGSVIAYSYEIKENELDVPKETLEKYGAVSKEVVEKMAETVRQKYNTDFALSASGIAGPGGATPDKPVGTVWIAMATEKKIVSEKFAFGNNRERNIHKTAVSALNMLRKELENL
jgi:nicotinamide-nucleotide amidase